MDSVVWHHYEETAALYAETRTISFDVTERQDTLADQLRRMLRNRVALPKIEKFLAYSDQAVGAYWDASSDEDVARYGRVFTENEAIAGSRVVMISEEYYVSAITQSDDFWSSSINLFGEKYQPIGTFFLDSFSGYSKTFIIPAESLLQSGKKITHVSCTFLAPMTAEQTEILLKTMDGLYENGTLVLPKTYESKALSAALANLLGLLFVLLLSLLNTLQLVVYWMKSNRRKFQIYVIAGARPSTVILLSLSNTFLLMLIAFAGGFLLFEAVCPYFIQKNIAAQAPPFLIAATAIALFLYVLAATFIFALRFLKREKLHLL
ncbi:MAG: hypothetical protein LBB67_08150 [Oscillospiraceae bacterium]|nr:hypothetical protein [Oscillospiraceae bacterium]